MNDDVIRLREALYEAEPFLTYLLTDRTVERNTKPLERALSMVREVLDMPQFVMPKALPPQAPEGEIELISLVEQGNGRVSASFDISDSAAKILLQIGLTHLLARAAEEYQDGE